MRLSHLHALAESEHAQWLPLSKGSHAIHCPCGSPLSVCAMRTKGIGDRDVWVMRGVTFAQADAYGCRKCGRIVSPEAPYEVVDQIALTESEEEEYGHEGPVWIQCPCGSDVKGYAREIEGIGNRTTWEWDGQKKGWPNPRTENYACQTCGRVFTYEDGLLWKVTGWLDGHNPAAGEPPPLMGADALSESTETFRVTTGRLSGCIIEIIESFLDSSDENLRMIALAIYADGARRSHVILSCPVYEGIGGRSIVDWTGHDTLYLRVVHGKSAFMRFHGMAQDESLRMDYPNEAWGLVTLEVAREGTKAIDLLCQRRALGEAGGDVFRAYAPNCSNCGHTKWRCVSRQTGIGNRDVYERCDMAACGHEEHYYACNGCDAIDEKHGLVEVKETTSIVRQRGAIFSPLAEEKGTRDEKGCLICPCGTHVKYYASAIEGIGNRMVWQIDYPKTGEDSSAYIRRHLETPGDWAYFCHQCGRVMERGRGWGEVIGHIDLIESVEYASEGRGQECFGCPCGAPMDTYAGDFEGIGDRRVRAFYDGDSAKAEVVGYGCRKCGRVARPSDLRIIDRLDPEQK